MPDKTKNDAAREDPAESVFGDVEEAGETTAADTISGPADTRPVGTDTMVKVSDTAEHARGERDS